jgi:signal transduction histidine kinase
MNNFSPIREVNHDKERFYKKLLSKLPDLIFQLEYSVNGRLTFPFFNKAVISYFEFSIDRLREFNLTDVFKERIHFDDFQAMIKSLELIDENQSEWLFEFRAVLPEKGLRWFKAVANVEYDELDTLILFGQISDVTMQKEEEKELKKTMHIINEQNNRLLNFAHIVSHNLNSHTSNFRMLLDLIEQEDNPDFAVEMFQHLRTSSNALTQTIDHLKELVDINTNMIHKKEFLNLDSYLNRVLIILSEEINNNKVKIYKRIPKDYRVAFNPSYLESILLNFTTNAIKYSHPDRIPEIYYDLEKENDKFVLKISDNGLGIDLDKYGEKLFGMYKTFHNNPNARGIGLFITRNQIESMGGKVAVESKKNVGTTFKVFFNNEI